MITYSRFVHEASYFPITVPTSTDYRVSIGGEEIPVYTCRISAYPFNTWWPGHQRPINQTDTVSYVNLVTDEDVTLKVTVQGTLSFERVMLKPYAKGVQTEREGNVIRFTLKEHGGYVLELDDYHHLLYVFNNKPVSCERPEDVTYYFGSGVHLAGKISLKSGESIYLEKDALVYGAVFAENAENIRVYGNGIFDDSAEERFHQHCYEPYTNGNVKLYDCKNVTIEGVGFVNSAVWCVNVFHCADVLLDGVNVFGQWRYNSDGVDIVNSTRVTVRNCFIHSFDDSVVLKGIDRYDEDGCEDILVENCVLWCDWGKTLEIGFETNGDVIRNVIFRDCDVLRGGNTVCDIQNGDCAEVSEIVFENIRVEMERFYTPFELQNGDCAVYSRKDEIEIPLFLHVNNLRFRADYDHLIEGNAWKPYAKAQGDPRFASVHDIRVKDLQIFCDEEILRRYPRKKVVRLRIVNQVKGAFYDRFAVENLTLNGTRVTGAEMEQSLEGDIGTLTVL